MYKKLLLCHGIEYIICIMMICLILSFQISAPESVSVLGSVSDLVPGLSPVPVPDLHRPAAEQRPVLQPPPPLGPPLLRGQQLQPDTLRFCGPTHVQLQLRVRPGSDRTDAGRSDPGLGRGVRLRGVWTEPLGGVSGTDVRWTHRTHR